MLCPDRLCPELEELSDLNPASGVVADNLCTYYYTSGSTGNPKAVMVTHRVGCRIQWANLNAVKLDERDRTLVTTSVSYGFFLGEFCSVLIRGGTAVLARPGGYQDIDYLVEEVERRQITVVCFVPSVLRHFLTRLEEQGRNGGRSLRHIVSHGEALPAALEDDLRTSLACPTAQVLRHDRSAGCELLDECRGKNRGAQRHRTPDRHGVLLAGRADESGAGR